MEALVKLQVNSKSIIEKGRINFKKSPKDRLTQSYIDTRMESLENQWQQFSTTHRQIIEIATITDMEGTYFTKEIYDTTEDIYITYKSELKELKTKPSTAKEIETKSCNVQLPKISLPKFSGLYTEWNTFRDLFLSLIDKNEGIDDVQKLHYLKAHLVGEAEQLLRHTPVTASNYKECWSVLTKRYDNKKYLSNCILKRFVNQPLVKESSASIKNLLDTTVDCLHGLRTLGIDVGSWDVIVIFIISAKLDVESRKLWEREISSSDRLPTFQLFKEFLESRFRSLENIDTKPMKQIVTNNINRNSTAKSFHVASQPCVLCSEDHKLCHCKQFAKKDCDDRREFVRANNLCYNCLCKNHTVYNCRQSTKCQVCKRKHHTLLHPKPIVKSTEPIDSSADQNVVVAAATASSTQGECTKNICCFADVHNHGLLATALVNVESRTGTAVVLRALMDQGSQVSFITESAVQLLGLRKIPARTDIFRLGDDEGSPMPSRWTVRIQLQSRLDPTFVLDVDAYVLSKLTSRLPERKIVQVLSTFSSFELADPTFDTPGKIDLLLSTSVVAEVLLEGLVKGPSGTPIAQNTKLGWIVSGTIQNTQLTSKPVCCHAIAGTDVNELLRRFWELESEHSSNKVILTEEEQQCEEFYSSMTRRHATGRYIVKLPFTSSDPKSKYGKSEIMAQKRFHVLERRLRNNPELQMQYSAVINEYLQLGHAEVVPQEDMGKEAVYLPHHAVLRNDKSTSQVRVVFDASCSGCNGVSLNDDLMVGPTLQLDLRQIIMRWRCHPIALVGDIVKMYRQVMVSKDDVNYQRILWRDSPDVELKHLRLLRVTFGTSSAPYLAVRSLQQLAYDDGKDFPLAASRVLSDFYVDDLLTGCESVVEAKEVYDQMNELLGRGGFQLQKWSSSNEQFLHKIKKETVDTNEGLEFKVDNIMKILGLTWDRKSDKFKYTVHLPELQTPVTKRKVISDIARLFDPLGWIAPVVTTAKVLIQRVWLSGIEWDDELPDTILKDWLDYRNNLHNLHSFHLPRWCQTNRSDRETELQGFCDASNVAYAAVVYIRSIDCNGAIHVSLVASRTKVAPVKVVSIPRLELCGALLLSKLLSEVSGTLGINKDKIHAWTDSSVVLAWLRGHPSRWNTFVGNRVSEILTTMENTQWSHIQSKDNPADCASRGMNSSEFVEFELWREGPKWLKNENIIYNRGDIEKTNLEERKSNLVFNVTVNENQENSIIASFSSLKRLTRVIAICRKFLKVKNRNKQSKALLSFSEINESLFTCIKICQIDHFKDEIKGLKTTGQVNKNSKLKSLNPYLDHNQILRVGGRLHRANLHEEMKHPVIIPHKSHFTTLLIADAHERTLHGGPQLVLNYLRSQYWVVSARSAVREYVRKCVTCIRFASRGITPLMGQLPSSRVNASRPFYRSGVDYAGPISIRPTKGRGYHSTKGYICLFVCMATRAIHLEVVSDMTSQAFLAAFKRFTARRGHCRELWSDNGATFVGANKELKVLFSHERSGVAPDIADWLATNGTDWHFIPPHSPNFGGLWEAGVKSTKHHLRRVIGNSTLTFEEMVTVLAQIEACLNSRPISALSVNADDPCPLTPGHFLVGEPLLLVPDSNFESSNVSTLKRWHLTQRMVQDFWRRWSMEYLVQFHQRHKWSHHTPEPNVGSVVLVMEDDLPPARWLYGLIIEKHIGSDKVTRVVSLRCKGSIIKRPVSKLIVLPVTQ